VTVNGVSVGEAAKLTDGTWEVHPEPVESSPWKYVDSAEEVVTSMVDFAK
jgi:hypothetical protein